MFGVNSVIFNDEESYKYIYHIETLAQERHNSIANALELRLSYINPSVWCVFKRIEMKCSISKWKIFPVIECYNVSQTIDNQDPIDEFKM